MPSLDYFPGLDLVLLVLTWFSSQLDLFQLWISPSLDFSPDLDLGGSWFSPRLDFRPGLVLVYTLVLV